METVKRSVVASGGEQAEPRGLLGECDTVMDICHCAFVHTHSADNTKREPTEGFLSVRPS